MNDLDSKILSDIVEGCLFPGLKIKIRELSEKYQAGPTPIRESLSRLIETKLVKKVENCGFQIVPFTEEEVRDIHKTSAEIEILALKLAIENGDEAWESDIVAKLYQLEKVESKESVNFAEWAKLNDAFHKSLVIGCGSNCLMEIRDNFHYRFKRYIKMAFDFHKDSLLSNFEEHKILANLVLERKSAEACTVLRNHFMNSLDDIIKNLYANGAIK